MKKQRSEIVSVAFSEADYVHRMNDIFSFLVEIINTLGLIKFRSNQKVPLSKVKRCLRFPRLGVLIPSEATWNVRVICVSSVRSFNICCKPIGYLYAGSWLVWNLTFSTFPKIYYDMILEKNIETPYIWNFTDNFKLI